MNLIPFGSAGIEMKCNIFHGKCNNIQSIKMIIVRLMGGHGNQMFQYAMGRYLAHMHNTRLKLDINYYKTYDPSLGSRQREFILDIFPIKVSIATSFEISLFTGHTPYKWAEIPIKIIRKLKKYHWQINFNVGYDEHALHYPDNSYIEGYWQSPKYFSAIDNMLRSDFFVKTSLNSKTKFLSDKIMNSDSVGIFIRRKDFVNHPLHMACGSEFYKQAVSIINDKLSSPAFFIFSDEIDWCKENFKYMEHVDYIGPELAGYKFSSDFYMLSLCKHFIISNSTYGWWAAWLGKNQNKIVIAPKKWYDDEKQNAQTSDLIPAEWIRI